MEKQAILKPEGFIELRVREGTMEAGAGAFPAAERIFRGIFRLPVYHWA